MMKKTIYEYLHNSSAAKDSKIAPAAHLHYHRFFVSRLSFSEKNKSMEIHAFVKPKARFAPIEIFHRSVSANALYFKSVKQANILYPLFIPLFFGNKHHSETDKKQQTAKPYGFIADNVCYKCTQSRAHGKYGYDAEICQSLF